AGDAKLEIEQTGSESLTITGDDNILPLIKSEVRDGQLLLSENIDFSHDAEQRLRYKLTVKDLNEISLSGDGSIDAKNIATNRLKVSISGDGVIRVGGSADSQDISISGDGRYEAADLGSKDAEAHISGGGWRTMRVSGQIQE